jgi:hypothetical protein
MGAAMSKKKKLIKTLQEWAKAEGIKIRITPLDNSDSPAPKTGLTGAELADYFSPKPAPKDCNHNGK